MFLQKKHIQKKIALNTGYIMHELIKREQYGKLQMIAPQSASHCHTVKWFDMQVRDRYIACVQGIPKTNTT